MLGKALWEGQLLELPLAGFVLKKMRGQRCDVNDLPSLDPELAKHLLALRHYKGE
jgi:ubiquitin-protein ligase E3 C